MKRCYIFKPSNEWEVLFCYKVFELVVTGKIFFKHLITFFKRMGFFKWLNNIDLNHHIIFLLSKSIFLFFSFLEPFFLNANSFSQEVPRVLSDIKSKDISRLSFTAGVTVNEEAGKQDSVVEQYLCPRSPPPLATLRASLPSQPAPPWWSPNVRRSGHSLKRWWW